MTTPSNDEPRRKSSEHSPVPVYGRLRELLLGYASRTTVDLLLDSACQRAGVTPVTLDPRGLERLIHELSPGVRMFCAKDEVPKLMLALADLFEH